jgi:hypothetical protein
VVLPFTLVNGLYKSFRNEGFNPIYFIDYVPDSNNYYTKLLHEDTELHGEKWYFCELKKGFERIQEHKNYRFHLRTAGFENCRYPLQNRDESKLLLWKNAEISEDVFKNATTYLPENSILVFNNTRVIHARLHFQKETGAKIEVFCLEPVEPADYQVAFLETQKVTWKCMLGNAKKWKDGTLYKTIEIVGKPTEIKANKISQNE